MSHSKGALRFKDGTIRYYEYNGTADVVISHHYETIQEVFDNWRKEDWVECNCGKEETVNIFSDYGDGFYLEGFACKNCNSINTEYDFDIIERDEQEDWAKIILGW